MKHNKIYADLDEIVFEGREKDYGAYQMRRRYNRILIRSSLIACLMFLCLTALPKVVKWFSPADLVEIENEEYALMDSTMIILPPIVEDEPIPEPPVMPPVKEEPAPPVKTIEFTVIEPAPEDEVSDTASVLDMEALLKDKTAALSFETREGEDYDGTQALDMLDDLIGNGTGGPLEVQPVPDPSPDSFFVGEPPKPVNMEELKNLIGYPERAKEVGMQGKVTVRVLVDKFGRYKKHIVLKSPSNLLTRPVEKQLSRLIFTPGIQNQKPVPVWVNIPFEFSLQSR